MIGWMQNWETCGSHLPEQRFMGQMTLPRELHIRNGRLCQTPVREIENYRINKVAYQNVMMTSESSPAGYQRPLYRHDRHHPSGQRSLHVPLVTRSMWPGTGSTAPPSASSPATNIIRIDRTQSGLPCDIVNVREFPVFAGKGS